MITKHLLCCLELFTFTGFSCNDTTIVRQLLWSSRLQLEGIYQHNSATRTIHSSYSVYYADFLAPTLNCADLNSQEIAIVPVTSGLQYRGRN
jgi:hypothetical protein